MPRGLPGGGDDKALICPIHKEPESTRRIVKGESDQLTECYFYNSFRFYTQRQLVN